MKVSIITPVFNDVRVCRALDSILAQRLDCELETIVIDAASTDGTHEVLHRYADRLNVCISEPDGGVYDGMNKGIGHATGDVVGILRAYDEYADADVLQDVVDVFRDRPDLEVCYGEIGCVDEDGESWRHWRAGRNRKFKWRLGWRPPHSAFFVRRRTYDSYGLYNLDYRVAGDYEMQLRLLFVHGLDAALIKRVLVKTAPGGNSKQSAGRVINGNLETLRAWRQHGLRGGFLVPMLKPANKLAQVLRSKKLRQAQDATADGALTR